MWSCRPTIVPTPFFQSSFVAGPVRSTCIALNSLNRLYHFPSSASRCTSSPLSSLLFGASSVRTSLSPLAASFSSLFTLACSINILVSLPCSLDFLFLPVVAHLASGFRLQLTHSPFSTFLSCLYFSLFPLLSFYLDDRIRTFQHTGTGFEPVIGRKKQSRPRMLHL